jgi:ABC-type multidrug transport system ATPase subunit
LHFSPGLNIIWGNNGVGKTSLLKLISGDLIPDSGAIIKDGTNITLLKRNKKNIFFIKQVPYDSLSVNCAVFENAASVTTEFSLSNFEIKKNGKYQGWKSHFGFKFGKKNPFWVQSVGSLSGGQAQKLNLFLCSISNADTILADEPTSGMDEENYIVFTKFINDIANREITVVIATHDERLKTLPGNHYHLSNHKIEKKLHHE